MEYNQRGGKLKLKKKLSLMLASVMALSVSLYSLASASETEIVPMNADKIESGYVYLNGEPLKENTTVYATEENQEELVEKYGLEKPSESAKLVSIQIVNNEPSSRPVLPSENEDMVTPQNILGYKVVKGPLQYIDGWSEIARAKYFCSKAASQECKGVTLSVSANQSVAVEVQSSLSVGIKDIVAAEFGRSVTDSIGVSTSVLVPMNVPGGKTGIAVGYPIYKSIYCQVYSKGIFSDTYLGGATFLEPSPTSIAVTSWVQG